VRLTTSLQVGAKHFGCLCAGSTLLLAPNLHPNKVPSTSSLVPLPKSASNNLRKWFLSPTSRLNFGFITEEKLTIVLITPYSWGSQLVHAPDEYRLSLGMLMHVKYIHDLCTLPLDIPPYLHHILVICMLFYDYWE
jgi:hypothetical protein